MPEPNYTTDTYRVKAKGKEYVYAWRGGPRLPGDYGSEESVSTWATLVAERKTGDRETIKGLITDFKASERWQGTAGRRSYSKATKAGYSFYLDHIEAAFGDTSLQAFERPAIREVIANWRKKTYSASPRNADYAIAVLRLLLSFGIRRGRLAVNHAKAMESLYESERSDLIWEDHELAALEANASAAIWQAARLAALCGLRQADLLRLRWSDVKEDRIEIQTRKSRKRNRAAVPLYPELKTFLATIPRLKPDDPAETVLKTQRGKRAWGSGFGASWAKALQAVVKARPDLKDRLNPKEPDGLHFHDLRGNAATRFYAAGFQPHEIARFMGWKEAAVLELLDRYVSDKAVWAARSDRLAKAS